MSSWLVRPPRSVRPMERVNHPSEGTFASVTENRPSADEHATSACSTPFGRVLHSTCRWMTQHERGVRHQDLSVVRAPTECQPLKRRLVRMREPSMCKGVRNGVAPILEGFSWGEKQSSVRRSAVKEPKPGCLTRTAKLPRFEEPRTRDPLGPAPAQARADDGLPCPKSHDHARFEVTHTDETRLNRTKPRPKHKRR